MRPIRGSVRPVIPGLQTMAARLAVLLVVGSAVNALLAKGGHPDLLPLVPAEMVVLHRFWQPLSYAFIATDPLQVIFGALILWQFGGSLELRWGARRLGLFAVGVTVLAGLATVLLAFAVPSLRLAGYAGAWVMGGALWVAYGLSFGRAETNFWGMPLSGNALALVGVGFTVLNALFGSWQMVVPEALGYVFTYLYMRDLSPRVGWLRFQNWRLQRQLRGRAKHLRLVGRDRNTPRDSDHYLH